MKKVVLELIPVLFAVISIFTILACHFTETEKNWILVGTVVLEVVYYAVYFQKTKKKT